MAGGSSIDFEIKSIGLPFEVLLETRMLVNRNSWRGFGKENKAPVPVVGHYWRDRCFIFKILIFVVLRLA
jgi:hypothetical protein